MTSTPIIAALLCAVATSPAAVTPDYMTVGNLGNPSDPGTGLGSVSKVFGIGKFEVSLTEYASFLNAVAATDTYSVWDSNMESNYFIKGISRTGNSGSFTYSVIGDGNRPVAFVTWFDSARFVNWLHNGQPTGSQGIGTTERGTYALNGAMNGAGFVRSANAQYWLPSENEWYKAAYHQPASAGGDTDGYWLYPMQTNSVPFSDQPPGNTPDNTRVGNWFASDLNENGYDDGFAMTGSEAYPNGNALSPGGAYTLSDSYYGTFDQAGNVWEWNEFVVQNFFRGVRGGSWAENRAYLPATLRGYRDPSVAYGDVGFRVATVPGPTAPLQQWKLTHLGDANAPDLGDSDGDGLTNVVEFAYGLNPTWPDTSTLPQFQLSGGEHVVSFATPEGVSGITYGAEWSSTMLPGSWTAIPDTGSGGQHTFSLPMTGSRQFLRLKVTAP